jgi:ribosome maturation factor RimP
VDKEVVMPGGPRHTSRPRQAQPGKAQPGKAKPGKAQPGKAKPGQAQPGGSVDEGKITEAIRPVVTDAGMDLEQVRVTAAGRRRLLRVVVDSDHGVSLDDAATISRQLSAALDEMAVMGDFPYTLEVSSPGVDRPLTDPRHWRRAVGRLVKVAVTDTGAVEGRIVSADPEGVTLDVGGAHRHFGYAVLGAGAIEVEFGHPQTELGATGDGH